MPQSVLTESIKVDPEISKVVPPAPPKKSSKAFNSFQIAQAQFADEAQVGLPHFIVASIAKLIHALVSGDDGAGTFDANGKHKPQRFHRICGSKVIGGQRRCSCKNGFAINCYGATALP